jgi:hypothetical protein
MLFRRKVHGIRLDNRVTMELIDRTTGKVVERKMSKNAVGVTAADALCRLINGEFTDANVIKNWKYLYLFRSDKTLIKVLEGTWGLVIEMDGGRSTTLTVNDSSTDEYTTAYQGLSWIGNYTTISPMALWQAQSITKTSDKILRCTWEVRIPYTSTP